MRFTCTYCKRILERKSNGSFKCTSCGHGIMKMTIPKTLCVQCNARIYTSVDITRKVTCSSCVERSLSVLEPKTKGR